MIRAGRGERSGGDKKDRFGRQKPPVIDNREGLEK
jgi:hypothetical protein